jgi:hypothetical protein
VLQAGDVQAGARIYRLPDKYAFLISEGETGKGYI